MISSLYIFYFVIPASHTPSFLPSVIIIIIIILGLTLTQANTVFLLEPAMNPALEDQAVNRYLPNSLFFNILSFPFVLVF